MENCCLFRMPWMLFFLLIRLGLASCKHCFKSRLYSYAMCSHWISDNQLVGIFLHYYCKGEFQLKGMLSNEMWIKLRFLKASPVKLSKTSKNYREMWKRYQTALNQKMVWPLKKALPYHYPISSGNLSPRPLYKSCTNSNST